MGKKALEAATGLDKEGRVARAKRRAESRRKAEAEAARIMFGSMFGLRAEVKPASAMIGMLPSGDPKESQDPPPEDKEAPQ